MKRTLTILALAALSAIASASSPIDNIYERCQWVMMRSTNCAVAIDGKSYPAGGQTLVSPVGWIDNDVINAFKATGYLLDVNGRFQMCAMAQSGCLQGWETQACRYSRAKWKQTPAPTSAEAWHRVLAYFVSVVRA